MTTDSTFTLSSFIASTTNPPLGYAVDPETVSPSQDLQPKDVPSMGPQDAPLTLSPVLAIAELVQHITPPTIDELFPDNVKPSTGVIAAGETLQTLGLNGPGAALQAAGQTMRSFGFDEDEPDSITGGGQTMDIDGEDDLGIFISGPLIATAIWGGIKAGAIAGGKIAAAAAIAYGTEKAIEAATSDIDSDEGLAQPWLPEVGVDVLA